LLETDTTVFGWEFVIMPRMKGIHLSDDLDGPGFSEEDRVGIAEAQGIVLREAQQLTNTFCGEYNIEANSILPYETDWVDEYKRQILDMLIEASSHNASSHNLQTPDSDLQWAGEVIEKACSEIESFTPTFCMQDFKPGNMVVEEIDGKWQVSGLFDLMTSSFGHPEADISRMYCGYVAKGRDDLAYAFINAYSLDDVEGFIQRFPLFMLHDRSIIWGWGQRDGRAWWDKSWTFKQWIGQFLNIDPQRLK